MAEHHTQGRQGQGSRRRRNNNQGRNKRHRMPRPAEAAPRKKPSFVERVLRFFGFGKKEEVTDKRRNKGNAAPPQQQEARPPRKTRIAKGRHNEGGNPAARSERRRATSTPPTRNARLYVGNLSYEATESELEDLFKGFGHVRSVEIIYNPRTYKSKGYAFVEMHHLKDAQKATEVLHGQPFMGRELMVSAASERPAAESAPDAPPAPPAEEATEQAND